MHVTYRRPASCGCTDGKRSRAPISRVIPVTRSVGRRQVQTLVARPSQLGQYEIAAWHSIQRKVEER